MTSAEAREARSAMRSAFILIRADVADNLVALVDALEHRSLDFVEAAIAQASALDALLDVTDVRTAVMRRAAEITRKAPPLRLVETVYDGSDVA